MTPLVRLLGRRAPRPAEWRDLRSPPPANDVTEQLVPLSRSLPRSPRELAALRATLNLDVLGDLRAAALLVLLGLGLRKHEIVALDVSDLVRVGSLVCVSVRSRAASERGRQTFVPLLGPDARVLKAYLARQHGPGARPSHPLFYNRERRLSTKRRRIAPSAISYWLLELRLRARRQRVERV